MLARDRMSSPAITVTPETPCQEALRLMQEHGCRRLPVIGSAGQLLGVVTLRDLQVCSPSLFSWLTTFEQHYLLHTVPVGEIMTTEVITTHLDTPIQQAARLMVEHKIGGLPVVDAQNRVCGVITETDLLKAFVELLTKEDARAR